MEVNKFYEIKYQRGNAKFEGVFKCVDINNAVVAIKLVFSLGHYEYFTINTTQSFSLYILEMFGEFKEILNPIVYNI